MVTAGPTVIWTLHNSTGQNSHCGALNLNVTPADNFLRTYRTFIVVKLERILHFEREERDIYYEVKKHI